jgi:DNA polymerase
VDLIEKLEPYCQLIQSNTDGILLKLHSIDDYEKLDDLVWEWEQRTGMRMEFEIFYKVFQKDVNNYLIVGPKGKIKTKGAYTKDLSRVDYDLPIINKALVEYMVNGTPVEKTIGDCEDLIMFQKVVKLSGKYWAVWHNYNFTFEKCYRVFASKSKSDTYIGKCKKKGATIEKFANTPGQCFIENGDINGQKVSAKLDRQWYVNLAKERLAQYGVKI